MHSQKTDHNTAQGGCYIKVVLCIVFKNSQDVFEQ